jgi:hypothetical protein
MDRTLRLWQMPTPLEGSVQQTVLWSEVLTGMEMDLLGSVQVLDAIQWRNRKQQLDSMRRAAALEYHHGIDDTSATWIALTFCVLFGESSNG